MSEDIAFWEERLTKAKAILVKYEDAVDALVVQGIQSYKLDTGQTIQTVTMQDLDKLNAAIDMLMNRVATLNARICGDGTAIMRPGW